MTEPALCCPLCALPLSCDISTATRRWYCPGGHSYSNPDALLAEVRWVAQQRRAPHLATEDEWDCGLVDAVLTSQPWYQAARTDAPHTAAS